MYSKCFFTDVTLMYGLQGVKAKTIHTYILRKRLHFCRAYLFIFGLSYFLRASIIVLSGYLFQKYVCFRVLHPVHKACIVLLQDYIFLKLYSTHGYVIYCSVVPDCFSKKSQRNKQGTVGIGHQLLLADTTDYGRPERKKTSLHGRKLTPTPKFLGMAAAYFVCHIGPFFQISLIYAFIGCP